MQIGDKILDFELPNKKGKLRSNKEMYRSYALAVIFYSSNCEVCQAYAKRIEKLAVKFENDDAAIILIDVSRNSEFKIEKQFSDLILLPNPNFIRVFDNDATTAKQFGAKALPEAFLFDRKRELVYRGAIDDNWKHPDFVTRVYLENAIDYTLDGMSTDFSEVEPFGTPISEI
ncbi:MAG: redoxin domain-containing protein [Bacteroidia bacterium]